MSVKTLPLRSLKQRAERKEGKLRRARSAQNQVTPPELVRPESLPHRLRTSRKRGEMARLVALSVARPVGIAKTALEEPVLVSFQALRRSPLMKPNNTFR